MMLQMVEQEESDSAQRSTLENHVCHIVSLEHSLCCKSTVCTLHNTNACTNHLAHSESLCLQPAWRRGILKDAINTFAQDLRAALPNSAIDDSTYAKEEQGVSAHLCLQAAITECRTNDTGSKVVCTPPSISDESATKNAQAPECLHPRKQWHPRICLETEQQSDVSSECGCEEDNRKAGDSDSEYEVVHCHWFYDGECEHFTNKNTPTDFLSDEPESFCIETHSRLLQSRPSAHSDILNDESESLSMDCRSLQGTPSSCTDSLDDEPYSSCIEAHSRSLQDSSSSQSETHSEGGSYEWPPSGEEEDYELVTAQAVGNTSGFNPYAFIKYLQRPEGNQPQALLPDKAPTTFIPTLVLDLDETLVHGHCDPDSADFHFPVFWEGSESAMHVRRRPHLYEFLETVCTQFEVIVFTASHPAYADVLLSMIDPEGKYFSHRLFREACTELNGVYLKDLAVLNRDLSTTCIIDNSPVAYGFQIDNGVPIVSWYDDDKDTELLNLLPFLASLQASTEDFRTQIRKKFSTYTLVDEA